MPVDIELVKQATKRPRPIEPEKFADLMRAWRRRCKLSRVQAAYALRSVAGLKTTDRTLWLWENGKAMAQRPLEVLELIHGPLAVKPPKPKPPERKSFSPARAIWPSTGMPATVPSRSAGPEPPMSTTAGNGPVADAGFVEEVERFLRAQ